MLIQTGLQNLSPRNPALTGPFPESLAELRPQPLSLLVWISVQALPLPVGFAFNSFTCSSLLLNSSSSRAEALLIV